MKNLAKFSLLVLFCGVFAFCASGQQQTDSTQNGGTNSTTTQKDSTDKKPKKVWTDEDLHGLGGVSVVGDAKSSSKKHSAASNSKDGTAANYKQQLEKLQAQLDDTDKKLVELRSFNGDSSASTAIQSNHRLSRGSVSDQIAQLEAKKAKISEQMQKIYDDARKQGIEPGALR